MDIKEKIPPIIECECGARVSVSPTSKGICPACGKQLRISASVESGESSIHTTFDPQDTPPPTHSVSAHDSHDLPSAKHLSGSLPMPDDGLDHNGKSSLTFVSDVKIRSREAANLVSRGKIVEAIALYRWICEEHPDHRDAYYGLGFCYYKLGDYNRSKWMLEKAMELEHPTAGKLLLKVEQRIEQEMLAQKNKEVDKIETNKVSDVAHIGDFMQDERK